VTDDKDRRCLLSTLETFYSPAVVDATSDTSKFSFDEAGKYCLPPSPHDEAELAAGVDDVGPEIGVHIATVLQLPLNAPPGVLGLHENAAIISALQETGSLLGAALNLQPRAAGSGGNAVSEWDSAVGALARDVLERKFGMRHLLLSSPWMHFVFKVVCSDLFRLARKCFTGLITQSMWAAPHLRLYVLICLG
jgi:dynein heavy chain